MIKDIQTSLKAQGYYNGNIDGKYGPLTKNAVIDFQEDNNLQTIILC